MTKTSYRLICAALAWVTLITQYILMLQSGRYGGFWLSNLTYFGYFTILTNILVALTFTAPFLKPDNKIGVFFNRHNVRAAIALYILVVAIVYYALLFKNHNPQGLHAITNAGLHFALPVLYIVDWLVFAKKDALSFKTLPLWVLYPFAYGLFNIGRGLVTGFYPYPFLNISERGYLAVTITMFIFCAVYIIGGAGFIALGRKMTARSS